MNDTPPATSSAAPRVHAARATVGDRPSTTRQHSSTPPWLKLAVRAIISLALVGWMVSHAALDDIRAAFTGVAWPWFAIALGFQFGGSFLTAWRWRLLLETQAVRLPQRLLFQSCIVAIFFKQFLPATVGGDASRFYDAWRAGAGKSVAAIALVVDRLLGLLALVLVAVVMLPFATQLTRQYPALYAWVLLAAAALAGTTWTFFACEGSVIHRVTAWLTLMPAALQRKLAATTEAVKAYRGRNRQLARVMLLSLALQVDVILFYWAIAQAIGLPVPLHALFVIVPVAIVVMLVPVSINAIGVREAVFVLLLAAYGVSTGQALAFAWLEYGMFLLYGLIGGGVYLLRR
ncbi:MAG: lysylphosphatidylglycerol synthase transmembrane domain-containing protein [Phycisphaeraceae bacterium]